MSGEYSETITKTFKFSFPTCTNKDVLFKLEVPVEIPYDGNTRELVQRIINMFRIPVYLEEELNDKLASFVSKETKDYNNERDERLINQFKDNVIDCDALVKDWEKLFKDNVVEYADQLGTSDEEVFAQAYHKLVHSPALETILQVESSYTATLEEMMNNKEEDIKSLTQKQTEEMEEMVRGLNTTTTEEQINALAAQHFEQQAMTAARWDSQLDAMTRAQKTQYRSWIMEQMDCDDESTVETPSNSPLATFTGKHLESIPNRRFEETYTIQLGSQLKQTHNVRLVTMDMEELYAPPHRCMDRYRRVSSALSLYSGAVSGAILLGSRELATLDAHFAPPPEQILYARRDAEHALENRKKAGGKGTLSTGDVIVTKHSSAAVHVLYHLIVDDTLKGDISSRHPVMLGLRNVVKSACSNDVTDITLPLLLTHTLTEEMTAAWCMRRAELVLKCTKGLLLEAGGWGGSQPTDLSLALPEIPPELASSLASLLASVLRSPAPRRLRVNH